MAYLNTHGLDTFWSKIKTWVNSQGFLKQHQDISGKQNTISDLSTIRTNASTGATHAGSTGNPHGTTAANLNINTYVSSTGTSGEWTYRKWSDGTVEAWGNISVSRSGSSTVKANYFYRGNLTASIPSGIFTTTPTVTAQLNNNYDKNLGFHLHATSATALEGRVMATNSFDLSTVPMNIYAIGT